MTLIDHGPWQTHAACAGMGPTLFYVEPHESVRDAREVCIPCTVREDCLTYALHNRELHGVWGGRTPKERRSMARRYRLAARQARSA